MVQYIQIVIASTGRAAKKYPVFRTGSARKINSFSNRNAECKLFRF